MSSKLSECTLPEEYESLSTEELLEVAEDLLDKIENFWIEIFDTIKKAS